MNLFGIAMLPEFHARKGAQGLTEGDFVSDDWSSNRGEAVTRVTGDMRGHVTGVLTTEAFIASEKKTLPKRIPVVPHEHNKKYPLDIGGSLRYFLSSSSN